MTEKVLKKLNEFKRKCLSNPVFPDCDLVNEFIEFLPKLHITIETDRILYRARSFNEKYFDVVNPHLYDEIKTIEDVKTISNFINKQLNDKKADYNNGFAGYNAKDSFVNPDVKTIPEGRCNRQYEQCLYCCDSTETAISELRPVREEKISVAEIKVEKKLDLIDISFYSTLENELLKAIALLFVFSPIENNYDIYKCSQVICSIVKNKGYDGIKYSSCQTLTGNNYAIFDYSKCKPISSKVYDIEYVRHFFKEANYSPYKQNDLLDAYKQIKNESK